MAPRTGLVAAGVVTLLLFLSTVAALISWLLYTRRPGVATPPASPGVAAPPVSPGVAAPPVSPGVAAPPRPVAAAPTLTAAEAPVNCVGQWGVCDKDCGTDGTQTYTIITPAKNGGAGCKDAVGLALSSTSKKSCGDLGPCGRNCEGAWVKSASTDADGWSKCPSCGPGNQVRTWRNDPAKTQIPPGLACLRGEGVTETRSCVNQPTCVVPVDCVGSWGPYGGCSVGCGENGTRTKTYTVTTNASNGGKACIDPDDGVTDLSANLAKRVKTAPCDPVPPMCCTDVSSQVGPWVDGGGDCGTNNPYGRPYRYQSRTLISGAKANQSDVSRCGFEIIRTLLTSRGCPNQQPNNVVCASGGGWDGTKCIVNPTGGSCPSGASYAGGGAAGDKSCSYVKSCPASVVRTSETCASCNC